MNTYKRYRYPQEIISHAVWLYHRFTLSFRDIEELLACRGIVVTYETIRQWCLKLTLSFAKSLRKKQGYCQLKLNYSDFIENSGSSKLRNNTLQVYF